MEKGACVSLPTEQPALRLMPMITDINGFGSVFGGWTMSQMDIAAGTTAMLEAGGKVTTAAAKIDFEKPLRVGNLVSFYAQVIARGRTSLRINVEAYAEPGSSPYADGTAASDVSCGYPYLAARAEFVFVAVDDEGHKRELPPLG